MDNKDIIKQLMNFASIDSTISDEILDEIECFAIQKVASTNTINEKTKNSSSKQSHIAITGVVRNMFPLIMGYGYFLGDEAEKRFSYRLPVWVLYNNKKVETSTICSARLSNNNQDFQIQLSKLKEDGREFIDFRKNINTNDFLIMIKIKNKFQYCMFYIRSNKINDICDTLNIEQFTQGSKYYVIQSCNTIINEKDMLIPRIDNSLDISSANSFIKPIQKIYFGAPGTGKSYQVTKLIQNTYPEYDGINHENVFRVTVYADYSYYNFIGTIMPVMNENQIVYDFNAGIFTLALLKALQHKDKHIFLIVEEMSRGNIASIFGDIFQLLDRKNDGSSEYSIDNELILSYLLNKGLEISKISLPSNLSIIGTVNINDQNVNVIDTAFKRRFEFEYVSVEPVKEDGKLLNSFEFKLGDYLFEWNRLYMALNSFIMTKLNLNEDKQIGQFFIKFGDDETYNKNLIKNKLLHYLWEDVQNTSVNNHSIFKPEISSFSQLYKLFEENNNVFSDDFLKQYEMIKDKDNGSN